MEIDGKHKISLLPLGLGGTPISSLRKNLPCPSRHDQGADRPSRSCRSSQWHAKNNCVNIHKWRMVRKTKDNPSSIIPNSEFILCLFSRDGCGGPSGRANINRFVEVLEKEFGVSATPRMRRGIDINAGCGQLTASVKKNEEDAPKILTLPGSNPMVGVYGDVGIYEDNEGGDDDEAKEPDLSHGSVVDFSINDDFINLDDEENDGEFIEVGKLRYCVLFTVVYKL